MTTKFPGSAVVMELAAFSKEDLMKAQVEWSPRSGDAEADALASGNFHGFDPAVWHEVDPKIEWEILPQALEIGRG